MAPPEKIRIPYEDDDDSRFNTVGRAKAGPGGEVRQFMAFITGAYPGKPESGRNFPDPKDPDWARKKRWYGVVHIFDAGGKHLQTIAQLGGTQADGKRESCERAFDRVNQILFGMGELEFCSIDVAPFRVEIDGYVFGLVYEQEDGDEFVMLWPNDVMFHPPWDGEYST